MKKSRARIGAGGAHEQLAGHVDADVDALLADDARLDVGSARPKQLRADVARLAVAP